MWLPLGPLPPMSFRHWHLISGFFQLDNWLDHTHAQMPPRDQPRCTGSTHKEEEHIFLILTQTFQVTLLASATRTADRSLRFLSLPPHTPHCPKCAVSTLQEQRKACREITASHWSLPGRMLSHNIYCPGESPKKEAEFKKAGVGEWHLPFIRHQAKSPSGLTRTKTS